jgi:hypothetical protein
MEDLSHIVVSAIPVKDGLPALPKAVMDGFSDAATIVQATKLMGFTETEAPDGDQ